MNEENHWLELVAVGVAEILPDGRFMQANKHLCGMLRCSREELLALALQDFVPPGQPLPWDVRDVNLMLLGVSQPHPISMRLRRRDGTSMWTQVMVRRGQEREAGGPYVVTIIDTTDQKETEIQLAESELRYAELELARRGDPLAFELNHRLRNLIVVIRILIKLTAERFPAAAEYRRELDDRLNAFAKTHDLMRRSESNSVTLEELVRGELLPFEGVGNITIEGPEVTLRDAAAQCFGIVLHELTTNAAKYGSLRAPSGSLIVRWRVTPIESGARHLAFEWIEHSDCLAATYYPSGFGTWVIRQSGDLLGGVSSSNFTPEGFRYRLELPINQTEIVNSGASSSG